ncbi:MAG: hypothetical protein JWQ00_1895 [Noviherbaspirillum sp.]|nr:hypothetical protein [Noviherbaspirillum sp.]
MQALLYSAIRHEGIYGADALAIVKALPHRVRQILLLSDDSDIEPGCATSNAGRIRAGPSRKKALQVALILRFRHAAFVGFVDLLCRSCLSRFNQILIRLLLCCLTRNHGRRGRHRLLFA